MQMENRLQILPAQVLCLCSDRLVIGDTQYQPLSGVPDRDDESRALAPCQSLLLRSGNSGCMSLDRVIKIKALPSCGDHRKRAGPGRQDDVKPSARGFPPTDTFQSVDSLGLRGVGGCAFPLLPSLLLHV